jgi:hypothetical protein
MKKEFLKVYKYRLFHMIQKSGIWFHELVTTQEEA